MEFKSPFKLSLIFLLAAAPTAATLAQPVVVPPPGCPLCSFSGFTVGLGVGATTFMTKNTISTTLDSETGDFVVIEPGLKVAEPLHNNSFTNNASRKNYDYGAMGALYIGFGDVMDNHMYWGAELGVNFLGATNTNANANSSSNVEVTSTDVGDFSGSARINHTFDGNVKITRNSVEPFLDLKLGWLMTPTALAYVKGGINYNRIKIRSNGSYEAEGEMSSNDPIPPNFAQSVATSGSIEGSHSKGSVGYRAGVGMEVMITPEFGVGADYVYTFYRKVNFNGTAGTSGVSCDALEGCQIVPATLTHSAKVTPSDQQVMAQLVYHLGYLG